MGIALLDKINAEQTAGLATKNFPDFHSGDIVRVAISIPRRRSYPLSISTSESL